MREPRIRECLPAIADIFAYFALMAMLLWFDAPSDDEMGEDDSELCRARRAEQVTELQARCQRWMRQALACKELQRIVSDIEDGAFDPDAAEAGR